MSNAKPARSESAPPAAAILLCAGYGTRMGSLTVETPKPLLPVAGRPLLDPLLDQIAELPGLEKVHIVTNHRHAAAFEVWARRHPSGLELILHDDGSTSNDDRLGAIGDLDFVLRRLPELPGGALVAAGDNILRFSLGPFWRRFLDAKGRGSGDSHILALEETSRERLRRTGVLRTDGDRVIELVEKPADPPSTWSSPACYALSERALGSVSAYLDGGGSRDEIGRFIGYLVHEQVVRAFKLRGERLHVGNPQELGRANALLASEPVVSSDGAEVSA